jgi:hypothetical protein
MLISGILMVLIALWGGSYLCLEVFPASNTFGMAAFMTSGIVLIGGIFLAAIGVVNIAQSKPINHKGWDMQAQEEFLKEVLELKSANPEARIMFCVSNELAEDYKWTEHKIYKVELSEYFNDDGNILCEESDIRDYFYNNLSAEEALLSDDEVDKIVDSRYKEQASIAICVFTGA